MTATEILSLRYGHVNARTLPYTESSESSKDPLAVQVLVSRSYAGQQIGSLELGHLGRGGLPRRCRDSIERRLEENLQSSVRYIINAFAATSMGHVLHLCTHTSLMSSPSELSFDFSVRFSPVSHVHWLPPRVGPRRIFLHSTLKVGRPLFDERLDALVLISDIIHNVRGTKLLARKGA